MCLEESLYIHNIRDMKVLHTIRETPPNPAGKPLLRRVQACETVQHVKALTTKPNYLSMIPTVLIAEEEN